MCIRDSYGVACVLQEPQLGTGHAVAQAEPILADFQGDVLVLYGDVPLLQSSTLRTLWDVHRHQQATVTVVTAYLDNPTGYGRIPVSYTHLRAHETPEHLVCRL